MPNSTFSFCSLVSGTTAKGLQGTGCGVRGTGGGVRGTGGGVRGTGGRVSAAGYVVEMSYATVPWLHGTWATKQGSLFSTFKTSVRKCECTALLEEASPWALLARILIFLSVISNMEYELLLPYVANIHPPHLPLALVAEIVGSPLVTERARLGNSAIAKK